MRAGGGSAAVADVAHIVLRISGLDPKFALGLVSDLISDDPRLRLSEDGKVELAGEDVESKPLNETEFVVVDVETTGAKTPPARIMEIGAYRVARGRIVAEFETLVNPEAHIPYYISELTGITNTMVSKAPKFSDVAEDWLRFAGAAVIVAHNAPFDVRFLNYELARVYPGRRMLNPNICTVSLARRVLPELSSHKLDAIAQHFSIPIPERHRAPSDARATAQVFLHILERLSDHGVTDLAQARKIKLHRDAIQQQY
ncbi:MAG: exonuclease domain-containing protein [Pyrinomonadaceae bacterium]